MNLPSRDAAFDLTGQAALITGGGTGLGFGMARCLVASGANVVLVGRRKEELAQACATLGPRAFPLPGDITKLETAPALVDAAEKLAGPLTLLVNNATGSATGPGNIMLNGGTLGGHGTIAGAVIAGTGPHTIYPSAALSASSTGTLTVGTLTTNAFTTLAFNLITPGSASDIINVTVANGLTLYGNLVAFPNHSTGAGSLGYYKIIQYSGTVQGAGIASLVLPATQNSVAYVLDTAHDPGFVDVHRGLLGDANDDGLVNFSDFVLLSNHFGMTGTGWTGADFNNDGITNFADFTILSNNFGGTIGADLRAASLPSSVPEPRTLLLLAAGLLPLLSRPRPGHKPVPAKIGSPPRPPESIR